MFAFLIVSTVALGRDFLPLHSHNDYQQKNPFWDAYRNEFQSVEADLWLTFWGNIKVAHTPFQNKGHFEELYLKPLQKELDENLFPYWSHRGMILWLDLKDPRACLRRKLARLLEKYPVIGKEVEVVITGMAYAKKRFVRDYPHLGIKADADEVTEQNLSGDFTWYALKWGDHFKWKGQGEMPPAEVQKLSTLVKTIHDHGKKLRFYASPDTVEYWRAIKQAGVDLIDTDHPAQLADFWKTSSFSP